MPKRESYLQPPVASDAKSKADSGFDRLMSRVVGKYPHLNIGNRSTGEVQTPVARTRPRGTSRSSK